MSTAFAAAQSRLGASVRSRLSNVSAQPATGSTVDGIFTRRPVDGSLGGAGFVARAADFVCGIDVAGSLAAGSQLTISGEVWKVALRTDDYEVGEARFDLERA